MAKINERMNEWLNRWMNETMYVYWCIWRDYVNSISNVLATVYQETHLSNARRSPSHRHQSFQGDWHVYIARTAAAKLLCGGARWHSATISQSNAPQNSRPAPDERPPRDKLIRTGHFNQLCAFDTSLTREVTSYYTSQIYCSPIKLTNGWV